MSKNLRLLLVILTKVVLLSLFFFYALAMIEKMLYHIDGLYHFGIPVDMTEPYGGIYGNRRIG